METCETGGGRPGISAAVELRDVDESWKGSGLEISNWSFEQQALRSALIARSSAGFNVPVVVTHVTAQHGIATMKPSQVLDVCDAVCLFFLPRKPSCAAMPEARLRHCQVLDTRLLNERQRRVDSTAVSRSSVSAGVNGRPRGSGRVPVS
jgi:hypothetical protein